MTDPYGERLTRVIAERGPLCVGVDPHPAILRSWGLDTDVRGLEACARGMVAALGQIVPVFKPQSAFFEAYGSAGVAVLERVLVDIADAGALSLLDVKRGDIGSTMEAYAAAYLADGSPLAADAITLSPYLGFGSLAGAIEVAGRNGRGVYVLALTSNPEGPQFQAARTADDRSVGQVVVDEAARSNADEAARSNADEAARSNADEAARSNAGGWLGHVGIVAGATIGRTGVDFSRLNGSILAPGLGAQGAGAADLAAVFGPSVPLVLPTMSREVMRAGPGVEALRAAATRALAEMKAAAGLG